MRPADAKVGLEKLPPLTDAQVARVAALLRLAQDRPKRLVVETVGGGPE